MALLLARLERKQETKSKFAYVIPMTLDSPVSNARERRARKFYRKLLN